METVKKPLFFRGMTMVQGRAAEKWIRAWGNIGLVGSCGWEAGVMDVEAAASPELKTHLYVYDRLTGWAWMASVLHAGFSQVAEAGKKAGDQDRREIRGGLAQLATRLADGVETSRREAERDLALLAGLYAGGTKTYSAGRGFPDGAHFVVILYRKKIGDNAMLRPFAMSAPPGRPVAADVFKATVEQVVTLDGVNHPWWLEGKEKKDE